jgi:hypothetical protein
MRIQRLYGTYPWTRISVRTVGRTWFIRIGSYRIVLGD